MTAPTDPPSGRGLDAEQKLATLRHWAASSTFARHPWVRELVDEYARLTAAHADCSNLSHAEVSRIFEEARQMREERDAAREALAALREAAEAMAAAAERVITRRGTLQRYEYLAEAVWHYQTLAAARPDEPTGKGG